MASFAATCGACRGVRTCSGVSVPVGSPPFLSVCSASYAGPLEASESDPARPILMPANATTRAPMTSRAAPAASQRRLTTPAAHRPHHLLAVFSWRIFGQSTLGPMLDRIAGVRVRVVSTLASGISAPPIPMLRMKGTGSTTSASRPMATVTPLKITALPAVSMATTTASWLSRPWSRSSRQRVTSSSE